MELDGVIARLNEWIVKCTKLSRWSGHDEKIKDQLEGCIRLYRDTGSFLRFVYKTLESAGRRIRQIVDELSLPSISPTDSARKPS